MTFGLPIEDVLVQFTVVVTATLAVQFLFEHSRLPGIVGLLLLGMLLGPGGGAVLPDEPVVELLGSIGLLYIMFLAGLEIDLDVVRRRTRDVAAFGGLAFVLSLVPAVVAGVWLGMGWAGALLLGAALSSHTLLSYPVVEKTGPRAPPRHRGDDRRHPAHRYHGPGPARGRHPAAGRRDGGAFAGSRRWHSWRCLPPCLWLSCRDWCGASSTIDRSRWPSSHC
jgi:hypothetical protein